MAYTNFLDELNQELAYEYKALVRWIEKYDPEADRVWEEMQALATTFATETTQGEATMFAMQDPDIALALSHVSDNPVHDQIYLHALNTFTALHEEDYHVLP